MNLVIVITIEFQESSMDFRADWGSMTLAMHIFRSVIVLLNMLLQIKINNNTVTYLVVCCQFK